MCHELCVRVGVVLLLGSMAAAPAAHAQAPAPPEVETEVGERAEETPPAEGSGEGPRGDETPPIRARRDDIRPRWGLTVGGLAGTAGATAVQWRCIEYVNYVERCEQLGVEDREYVQIGFAFALQMGVQSDWLGGFLLARGAVAVGSSTMFHLTLGLVAEVTLFDVLQVGVGATIDAVELQGRGNRTEQHQPAVPGDREYYRREGTGSLVGSETLKDVYFAPGLEVRLGLVGGGGPYERRGFVFTSFFHLTAGPHTTLLGGLELGFESF